MNLKEKGYGITVLKEKKFISGFNGSKPIFDDAMDSRSAHKFYKMFIKMLRQMHDPKLVKGKLYLCSTYNYPLTGYVAHVTNSPYCI